MEALDELLLRLPKGAHRAATDAYLSGLGKAMGKAVAREGKRGQAIGAALAEGFFKGVGTALAFLLIFGLLWFFFRDSALGLMRVATGYRGAALAAIAGDQDPRASAARAGSAGAWPGSAGGQAGGALAT